MSSSHKKTKKVPRPRLQNSRGVIRKVDDDDYVQLDVPGDGNCFYYAIYGAAKYHTDPSVYGKLLACFGIENKASLTINEFAKKVRVKLAQEIQKEHGIMEAQEAIAVEQRQPLEYGEQRNANLYTMLYEASKRIWAPTETFEYKDLERMLRVSTNALAEAKARYMSAEKGSAARRAASKNVALYLKEIRKGKQNLKDVLNEDTRKFQWQAIKEELSRQIATHPLLGNARAYETMTKQQFKDAFVKLLAGNNLDGKSSMYASQPDVELIDFFLSSCGTPLRIITVLNPERVRIVDSNNGVPILHVRLLKDEGFDHYNYYVRGDKFKENVERLKREAIRVKKQHAPRGNTPETPESVSSNNSSSNNSSASSLPSNSSSNGLSSLSPISSNTNSNSSTRKAKKPSSAKKTKQYALLERKRNALAAAAAPAPAKGSMNNLTKRTKPTNLPPIPFYPIAPYRGVHERLRQYMRENEEKRKAKSNTRKQPRSLSPEAKRQIAIMNAPPKPSAPPASPPRLPTRKQPRSLSPEAMRQIAIMNAPPKPSAPPASPPRLPTLKATTDVSEFNNLNSLSSNSNSNNELSPNTLAQIAAINTATKARKNTATQKKPIEGLQLSPRTKAQYEQMINPTTAPKPQTNKPVSRTQTSLIAGLKALLPGKKTQKNKNKK